MNEENGRLILELESVSLNYHSKKASFDQGVHHILDNVSLKLYEGETLGIIGRNGVGKTTMLRLMAGILAPSRGSVWQRPGKSSSLLTIGLGFRPDLSGRDNALLAAMLQGAPHKQAKTYLEDIKEFAELGDSFEGRSSLIRWKAEGNINRPRDEGDRTAPLSLGERGRG